MHALDGLSWRSSFQVLALMVAVGLGPAGPVANAASFGLAAPIVSVVEDVIAVVTAVLAVFLPVLVLVMAVGLGFLAWRVWGVWARRHYRTGFGGFANVQNTFHKEKAAFIAAFLLAQRARLFNQWV